MTKLVITEDILPTLIHASLAAKNALGFWQREHNKIHKNNEELIQLEKIILQAQHTMRMDCHEESWPKVDSQLVLLLTNLALADMENEQPMKKEIIQQQQNTREQLWKALAWAKAGDHAKPILETIGHVNHNKVTLTSAISTVLKK